MARQLDSEASIQQARVRLDRAGRTLRAMVLSLEALTEELDSSALDDALPRIEQALDESLDAHARIDADLLIGCTTSWSHPVQALLKPRAPYGRTAVQCQMRMARAQGDELERLQSVYERVLRAHELAETAWRRRMERLSWLVEGTEV